VRAMAHTNPIISRAMAVTTTCFGLPRANIWRYRLHSRNCARQAMSLTSCGKPSERGAIFLLTRSGKR
jgi:hypothetical protein